MSNTVVVTDVDALLAPSLVQNGRYVIKGKRYTRVTNFVKTIEDRFNIERWQQRMVGVGLALQPDLLDQIRPHVSTLDTKATKDALNDLMSEAREIAGASKAADTGTLLHDLAERLDRGEEFDIPVEHQADLDEYRRVMAINGVRTDPSFMENVILHHGYNLAGRFDRLVRLDGFALPMVGDLKTGSIDFGLDSIAAQLHVYASADEIYDPATDTLSPMPKVDQDYGLIIHLPQGEARCELHLVDLNRGREVAELCKAVKAQRSNRLKTERYNLPATDRARNLTARVQTLIERHPEAAQHLAARWPAGVPTFKEVREGQATHTDEHLERIAVAVANAEAAHAVPFAEPDPSDAKPTQAVVDGLALRLGALPSDLLAEITSKAKGVGITNVRSPRFTRRHADELLALLPEFEEANKARVSQVADLIGSMIDGDPKQYDAIADACGVEKAGGPWTHMAVDKLYSLSAAMSNGALVYDTSDGKCVLKTMDGEKRLVDFHGNKSAALAAVKTLAEAFDLPKPKSAAEAAANPTLLALAVAWSDPESETTE